MSRAVAIYGDLAPEAQSFAREAAKRVSGLHRKVFTDIIEIGQILAKVKETVGHGNFLPWVKSELSWSDRTAENYMAAAERFADKIETVSNLPLTTVYRLAAPSIPNHVREEIVSRLEQGGITPSEVTYKIAEARKIATEARDAVTKHERKTKKKLSNAEREERRQHFEQRLNDDRRKSEERQIKSDAARREAANLVTGSLSSSDLDRLPTLLDSFHYLRSDDLREAMGEGGLR